MDELNRQEGATGPAPPAGPSGLREQQLAALRAAAGLEQPQEAPVVRRSGLEALREREAKRQADAERARRMAEEAENEPNWFRKQLNKVTDAIDTVKQVAAHTGAPAHEREGFAPLPVQPQTALPADQALPSMAPQPLPESLQPSLPQQFGVTPEDIAAQEAEAARVAQMTEAQAQLAGIVPRAIGRMDFVGPTPEGAPISLSRVAELERQAGMAPGQAANVPGLPGYAVTEEPVPQVGMGQALHALRSQFESETAGMSDLEKTFYMEKAVAKQAPPAIYETLSSMVEGFLRATDYVSRPAGDAVAMMRTGKGLPEEHHALMADAFAKTSDKVLQLYPWLEPENAAEVAAAGIDRMLAEMYVFMAGGRTIAKSAGVDVAKLKGIRGGVQAAKYYGPLDVAIGAASEETSSLAALEGAMGDMPGFDATNPLHRGAFELMTGATADVIFGVIGDSYRAAAKMRLNNITKKAWDTASVIDNERAFLNEVVDALEQGGHNQEKVREVMLALPPAKREPFRKLLGPGQPVDPDAIPGAGRVETINEGTALDAPRTIGEEPLPPRDLVDERGQAILDVREDVPTSLEVGTAGADRLAAEAAARQARLAERGVPPAEGELPTAAQAAYRRSGETLEEFGRELEAERAEFDAARDLERRTAGPLPSELEQIRLQRELRARAEETKKVRTEYRRIMNLDIDSDELKEIASGSDAASSYERIAAQQRLEGREVFPPEYVAGQRAYDDYHRGDGIENRRRTLGGDTTSEEPLPPTPEVVRAAGDDLEAPDPTPDQQRGAFPATEQGQAASEATGVLDDTTELYERLAQGNPAFTPFVRDPVRGLLFAAGTGAAMLAAEGEGADGETLAMLGIFGISGANPRAIRRMAINGLGVQAAAHLAEGVSRADWSRQMRARYGADFTEEIAEEAWQHGSVVLGKMRERSAGLIERMVDIEDADEIGRLLKSGLSEREVFVDRITNAVVPRGEGLFSPDQVGGKIKKFIVKPRTWYKGSLRKLTKFFGNERDADLFLRMYSILSPQRVAATSNITLAIRAFNAYKAAEQAGTLLVDGAVDPALFKGIGNKFQAQELADGIAGFPTTTVKRSDFTAGFRQGAKLPRPVAEPAAPAPARVQRHFLDEIDSLAARERSAFEAMAEGHDFAKKFGREHRLADTYGEDATPGSIQDFVAEEIHRVAREHGVPVEDVTRRVDEAAKLAEGEFSRGSRKKLNEHPPTKAAEREMDQQLEHFPGVDRDRAFQYLADAHNDFDKTRVTKREVEELFEGLVRDRAAGRNLQGYDDLRTRLNVPSRLRAAPVDIPEPAPRQLQAPVPGRVVSDAWLGRLFGLVDLAGSPVFRFGGATKGQVVDDLVAAGWDKAEARKFVFAMQDGDEAVLPKKYASGKATAEQRNAAGKYIQQRKTNLTEDEYDFISERVRIIAEANGLDSYEAQSVLWVAAKLAVEGETTDIRALHQILSQDPRFRSGMYDPERGFLVEGLEEARDVARAVEGGETRAVGEDLQGVRNEGLLDSSDPAGAVQLGKGKRPIMHPAIKIGDEIIEAPFEKGRRGMHIEAVNEAIDRGIGGRQLDSGVDGFVAPNRTFFDRRDGMEALQKIGLASAVLYAYKSGMFGDGEGEGNAEKVMAAMGLGALPGGARKRIARILVNAMRDFPGEGARIAGRTAVGAGVGAGVSAVVTPEQGKAGVLSGAAIGGLLGAGTGLRTKARLRASRFGEGVKSVGGRELPRDARQAFREARTAALDDIEPARKLTMEAEGITGRAVDADKDIETALRASRAWAPYAEMIMRDGVMAPGESAPRTKRGLTAIYQDVGVRLNDLRDYALARRAKELDKRGMDIPDELREYDDVISEFEGDELIETAFDDLQENFQELLRVAEEVGLIEPGGAKRIGAANQNYVPFWRDLNTTDAKLAGPFKQIIRQIKGSKFAVEDPIVTMVQAQSKFAEAIFRQQSANALWRFAQEHPEAKLISKVTDKANARPSDMPTLTGGAQDDLLENLPRAAFDADGAEIDGRQLRIYDQGQAVTFKVNDDLLWDAYVQAPEAVMGAVRVGALFSRLLREFVTTEPTFAATNFVRDVGTQTITSKTLGFPLTRAPKAFKDAMLGTAVALVSREPSVYNRAAEGALLGGALGYLGGTEDRASAGLAGSLVGGGFTGVGAKALARRAATRAGAESPEALYRAWVSSGGAQGVVEGFRTRREVMKGIVTDATRRNTVPIAHPIRVLQDMNRAVEEGNRLAEWIRLMERNGMDRTHPELMRDAITTRDLTTDFLRKGGSKTIQAVSMLKAFWNPRVQGYDRLARVFSEAARGTDANAKAAAGAAVVSTMAAITVPSLMLSYVNNKYHREEMLRDTTHFDRTYFWLVKNPMGEGFIRIPKPFEMGVLFGSLPERIMEQQVFGDDERLEPLTEGGLEEVANAFLGDLTETVSPVPTALDPFAENMTNKDFAGQPVVNPYELLQNKEPRLQDREGASEIGKWIADQLDVPPPQVDNVLTGYTGRVGEEALRIGDQILATMGESESGEPVAQRPSDSFLGDRFLSDTPRRTSASTTRYYEEFRDAEKVRNTIADTEGKSAATEWERTTPEGIRYKELKEAGDEIREMRNMQKQVEDAVTKGDVPWYPEDRADEPLTGEEKRRIIDRLSRLVDEVAFEAITGEEPEPLAPTKITF